MNRIVAVLFSIFIIGCVQPEQEAQQDGESSAGSSDEKAVVIVDRMQQAMGLTAWRQARFVSFRWVVERDGKDVADYRHDWDRVQNNYRVEGTNRDGKHWVGIFNTVSKEGDVYLDGTQVTDDSTRTKMLEDAYGRYINDAYWLIMPFKLKDPGVVLAYDGEQELDGNNYDVVRVTFEQVGLTPGDTYWAFIDQQGHLMKKWEYFLEGWEEGRARTGAMWQDWQDFGGVKLALNKAFVGSTTRIYFKEVKVSSNVGDTILQETGRTF